MMHGRFRRDRRRRNIEGHPNAFSPESRGLATAIGVHTFFLHGEEPPYELLVPIMGKRAVAEVAQKFAIDGGKTLTRTLIKKYLRKSALKKFKRIVLKIFGRRITQRALITKTLPIIGSGTGATWNYVEMKHVGKRVIAFFEADYA